MPAAAPPLLSADAAALLRRPPSLVELVAQVRFADDYAWFAGLVRRLFPEQAEETLSAAAAAERVERFARLFEERHFPLYRPFDDFWADGFDESPPWSWLRLGVPFQLMGFGYDEPHELWHSFRPGISALALLARAPEPFYEGLNTAWLESAAEHIPGETLLRVPAQGVPLDDLSSAVGGTRFEAAAQAGAWVFARTGNFFLDHSLEDDMYDGFADPWEDEVIAAGTDEWREAKQLLDAVGRLTDWLEADLPARFAELLDFVLDRLANQSEEEPHHGSRT